MRNIFGCRFPYDFDICWEFGCNPHYAERHGIQCNRDFWNNSVKCLFADEHKELNMKQELISRIKVGEPDTFDKILLAFEKAGATAYIDNAGYVHVYSRKQDIVSYENATSSEDDYVATIELTAETSNHELLEQFEEVLICLDAFSAPLEELEEADQKTLEMKIYKKSDPIANDEKSDMEDDKVKMREVLLKKDPAEVAEMLLAYISTIQELNKVIGDLRTQVLWLQTSPEKIMG
jgi:hypothetical protein